jgi:sigma-B regulation protein RsbU (phosphoserine phosphatase)
MLTSFLGTLGPQLDRLAKAWLANRATWIGLWEGDRPLALWPPAALPQSPSLRVPIQLDNRVLGELRVGGVSDPASQLRLEADAAWIAHLAALENEMDSMAEALGESQDQQLALYELTRATSGLLDVERILAVMARQSARLVKATGSFAVLAEPDADRAVVVQHPGATLDDALALQLSQDLQATGREQLINSSDLPDSPIEGDASLFLTPLPLREQEKTLATLGLWLDRPAASLSPDLKLARAIVEQAGAALEIALLHQEILAQARLQTEMELAQEVQLRLLPQAVPQVMGLDLFADSQPAYQVGGDFYDFLSQPGQPFTFTIGDVSGKGMAAALLMATTQSALRSATRFLADPQPETVMAHVNEHLYDDLSEVGMFVTTFVGQFDRERRQLLYANAGHSPVIYCPPDGPARLLEADGTAVGVLPMSLCQNQTVDLPPGYVLVAATDGFSEARDGEGQMFGYERLLRLVENLSHEPATEIGRGLFAALARFRKGQAQDDDESLVVAKGIP